MDALVEEIEREVGKGQRNESFGGGRWVWCGDVDFRSFRFRDSARQLRQRQDGGEAAAGRGAGEGGGDDDDESFMSSYFLDELPEDHPDRLAFEALMNEDNKSPVEKAEDLKVGKCVNVRVYVRWHLAAAVNCCWRAVDCLIVVTG